MPCTQRGSCWEGKVMRAEMHWWLGLLHCQMTIQKDRFFYPLFYLLSLLFRGQADGCIENSQSVHKEKIILERIRSAWEEKKSTETMTPGSFQISASPTLTHQWYHLRQAARKANFCFQWEQEKIQWLAYSSWKDKKAVLSSQNTENGHLLLHF